jgi:hypothetical protein
MLLWYNIHMNKNTNEHVEQHEQSEQRAMRSQETLERHARGTHERVDALAGKQMAESPSISDALHVETIHERRRDHREEKPDEKADAKRELEDTLDDVHHILGQLTSRNLAHRTYDFRDHIPIWAQIRSHTLTGREAELTAELHQRADDLERLGKECGVDTAVIVGKLREVRPAKGMQKWAATLLPFGTNFRKFRRTYSAPMFERLQRDVWALKRGMRRRNQAPSENGSIAA